MNVDQVIDYSWSFKEINMGESNEDDDEYD